jgi:hypothetical protein
MMVKLRQLDLAGAMLEDSVWVIADAAQADTLDVCCFGTYEGGADTVPSIAAHHRVTEQVASPCNEYCACTAHCSLPCQLGPCVRRTERANA